MQPLRPVLASAGVPTFAQATWIGLADDLPADGMVPLLCAEGFCRARLLLRHNRVPMGFAEVDVVGGYVDAAAVWAAVARDAVSPQRPPAGPLPAVTVAICTRNRPELLGRALQSVLRQPYSEFDVVVVDNSASSGATARYVQALGDDRVRVVHEPAPGLSRARNAALIAARHDIVAFTDDDVVVDGEWLTALGRTFAAEPRTACVTGLVPTGELTCAAHAYFDRRVGWARNLRPRQFDLADRPADLPLFPFQVGVFGTGANFAIRRDAAFALGGFNEILGAGAPAKGGEDLDMFFRIVMSGAALAYEPAAIVWHRHRDDVRGLLDQSHGYGLGLGAWLTTVALDPRARGLAAGTLASNLRTGWRLARAMQASATPDGDLTNADIPAGIGRVELTAIAAGPLAYLRGWREGRRSRPLTEYCSRAVARV
jgi:GT2 family glycosyltransferase